MTDPPCGEGLLLYCEHLAHTVTHDGTSFHISRFFLWDKARSFHHCAFHTARLCWAHMGVFKRTG